MDRADALAAILAAHPAVRAALEATLDPADRAPAAARIELLALALAYGALPAPTDADARHAIAARLAASARVRAAFAAVHMSPRDKWARAPVFAAWLRLYLLFWAAGAGPSPARAAQSVDGFWRRANMYRPALAALTMHAPYAVRCDELGALSRAAAPVPVDAVDPRMPTHVLMLHDFAPTGGADGRFALPRACWSDHTLLPLVEFGARAPCRLFVDMETPVCAQPRRALALMTRLARDTWDVARMVLRMWVPPAAMCAAASTDGPPRALWTHRLRAVPGAGWKLGVHVVFPGIVAPGTRPVRHAAKMACAALLAWHGHDPSDGPYATLDKKGMNTGLRSYGAKWAAHAPPGAPPGALKLPLVVGLPYTGAWVSHPAPARGPTDAYHGILPAPPTSRAAVVTPALAQPTGGVKRARPPVDPTAALRVVLPPRWDPDAHARADKQDVLAAARRAAPDARLAPGWPMRCRVDGHYRGFYWAPAGLELKCMAAPAARHRACPTGPQRVCAYVYNVRTHVVTFSCGERNREAGAEHDAYNTLKGHVLEL